MHSELFHAWAMRCFKTILDLILILTNHAHNTRIGTIFEHNLWIIVS